ncbi:bestrophin family protein [uncultured Microscilla sp.]|uniref:bestrophin family protein n=1 Tax=uncultured Microscilla sp. TaxID=432653 RepID=UPI0026364B1C|nr:bestrophin family ion channel [uncultured Microscilla sp.]
MYINKTISLRVILGFAWKNLFIFTILATLVCIAYLHYGIKQIAIPFLPLGTLGTAVAILLGFRNNSAYDRFWEARKIWGGIVNTSRSFARQVTTFVTTQFTQGDITEENAETLQKELVYRHLAWLNALRLHLRREDLLNETCWYELIHFISEEELKEINLKQNKPTQLNQLQGERLQYARSVGLIDDFRHMELDRSLNVMYDLQGKCERIKNTPLPRQYAFFTKVFVWIFVCLLPFGFVDILHWMTIPLAVLVSWIFTVLEQVGHYTEDPFSNGINDIPMTSMCRTIEIDLREQLKETELPKPLRAVNGVLM